jgi:hypothetical protein
MVAAALSILIAIGLLTAVTGSFQRDGAPFEQVVIAERACASKVFVSERETCVRSQLATSLCPERRESLTPRAAMRQCTIAVSTNAAAPGRSCTLHHNT